MAMQMPRFTNVGAQMRQRRRESDATLQAAQARAGAGGGEKPWYEKYIVDPLVKIGAGYVAEKISPAQQAATAASKARAEGSEVQAAATRQSTQITQTKETDRLLADAVMGMRNQEPGIEDDEIERRLAKSPGLLQRWRQGATRRQ
jgi:hypothetical protein